MASIESIRFAERFNGITGSAIREILKYMTRPNMISFGGGNPAASALEEDVIADIARDVLLADGKRILQYGATDGYAPYKEAVAGWVKGLGIDCSAQDVLPVTGSTQGIDLLAKALINPGDVVLDPFDGIGSTGYQALKMGRRHVGVELKRNYYTLAVENCRAAECERAENTEGSLFDLLGEG